MMIEERTVDQQRANIMTNVVKIRRNPRPLGKTYHPDCPYVMQRIDNDWGSIAYEVIDERPDSYRIVCVTDDDCGRNGRAKQDAENVARGLNMLVQYGIERVTPDPCADGD